MIKSGDNNNKEAAIIVPEVTHEKSMSTQIRWGCVSGWALAYPLCPRPQTSFGTMCSCLWSSQIFGRCRQLVIRSPRDINAHKHDVIWHNSNMDMSITYVTLFLQTITTWNISSRETFSCETVACRQIYFNLIKFLWKSSPKMLYYCSNMSCYYFAHYPDCNHIFTSTTIFLCCFP